MKVFPKDKYGRIPAINFDHCGVTPATFSKWVYSGIMPRPIEFTRRWDRKAIDMVLDKASGIVAPSVVPDSDTAEAAWEAKYATRKNPAGTGRRD